MILLEVPLYDDDIWKLLIRFAFNVTVVAMIIFFSYYRHKRNRTYVFNFLIMNVMVFFICFSLKKLDLGLGMALGLFAIFAIIRYRTDAIQVKEMTYLFVVIGVAVINSLSNKKTSYAELITANMIIFVFTLVSERVLVQVKMAKQAVVYDKLELLHPNRRAELFDDLKQRIGIEAQDVKIGKIDLEKANAGLTVYYDSNGVDDFSDSSDSSDSNGS